MEQTTDDFSTFCNSIYTKTLTSFYLLLLFAGLQMEIERKIEKEKEKRYS